MGYLNKPKKQTYNVIHEGKFISNVSINEIDGSIFINKTYTYDPDKALCFSQFDAVYIAGMLNGDDPEFLMDYQIIKTSLSKKWKKDMQQLQQVHQVQH